MDARERDTRAASDRTAARILNATIDTLIDFGVKRATVEQVARAAGVSHMTVYRRWAARDDLLYAAIEGEFSRLCGKAFEAAAGRPHFDERVVTAFGGLVWSIQSHPLMARELRTEPEVILPLLTTSSAPMMRAAVAVISAHLRDAADATGTTLDDPEALADILVRLAHSLLLVPHPGQPLTTRADIDQYARRYALPLTRSAVGVVVPR